MRVLHIINNLNSGGAEKLLEVMIPIINQSGDIEAEIFLLTNKNNVFYDSLIKKGVVVKIAKYNNIYDLRNIFEIKKQIKNGNYDIIHSHLFPTQYWLGISSLFLKKQEIKFITTEHNTHNRRRKLFFFKPIDKFIYSKYDLVISISEKTKDNLLKWIDPKGKNLDKHTVIENGIDLDSIEKVQRYNKADLVNCMDSNLRLVCMVGRFTEQKDQPTLIKAIGLLPDNIHLVLLGDGDLKEYNENLAKDLGISHRVHFLGFRSDVFSILKTVDIVVLSSHWEGFGLAAAEGMAVGKPVIASDVEGLSDIVGKYGLLFPKGDVEKLSNMIMMLVKDQRMYDEISIQCMERSKQYDINIMVKEYHKQYEKCLG